MDDVEQFHCLGRLVRLEPANSMQPDVRVTCKQRRPFGERLLHAILAEVALTAGDKRLDLLGRSALADGDELNVGRLALGERSRMRDCIEDLLPSFGGAVHRSLL